MISPEMLKETMEHFSAKTEKKEEQNQDKWAGFKRFNVGGQEVIDLTSVDVEYSSLERFNRMCPERVQLYGEKAASTRF